MINYFMNRFPAYMDDRLALEVILSDDLKYRHYDQVLSYLVSSWYDPSQDRAFTATSIDDVPEEFHESLIQHDGTLTSTSNVMYPDLDFQTATASSSRRISFLKSPDFEGDFFKISWDAEKDYSAVSTYHRGFDINSLSHEYDEYGKHVIKFSTNVKNAYVYTYYDSSLRSYANDRICKIDSRCQSLEHLCNMNYSRCLQSIKAYGISCIDAVWYDGYELTSIELPDLETITCPYAVNCLYNLKKFTAPKLKFMNNATGMFKGDIGIEQICFPELTCISGDYADKSTGMGYNFMTNMSLTSVSMPKLVSGMKSDFAHCINLKDTDFSSLSSVEENMFKDCLCLKQIKLPSVKRIKASSFYRCQNLQKIDLSEANEVPALDNINAFNGILVDYKVLVNRDMIDAFKAASNWSNPSIVNHITSI